MLLVMCNMLSARLVQGQAAPGPTGGSGGATSAGGHGEDGYSIQEDAAPTTVAQVYTYNRTMPENGRQVYWVVTNARVIEGVAAESWAEGSLDAATYSQLRIEWRDSVVLGRVALRYSDADTGENREAYGLPVALPASMPLSGGLPGFAITGETAAKSGTVYTYERELPETGQPWYWVVKGAKTINGIPADSVAPGSLLASNYSSIKVEWKDSTAFGRLALQHQDHETGEVEEGVGVLIAIAGAILAVDLLCAPAIEYKEYRFGIGTDWNDLPKNGFNYTLCLPNIQATGSLWIAAASGGCTDGSTWRFEYTTENGHKYAEIWSSTSDKFDSPPFYDVVPYIPFGPNGARYVNPRPVAFASFAGPVVPSPNYTPWTTGPSGTSSTNNPYTGERIIAVQVFAGGKRCGLLGLCGDVNAQSTYLLRGLIRPGVYGAQKILANGARGPLLRPGQALCVGKRYQLLAEEDRRTTGSIKLFEWSSNTGTITRDGAYPNTYDVLNLQQVTAANAPFQIDLSVFGRNPGQTTAANCFTNSSASTATFYLRTTPQPQNLRMDGNPQVCTTTAPRKLRVDLVAGATKYYWQVVSGPGRFDLPETTGNSSDLTFTGTGTVAVEVTARTDCDRTSIPAARSFSTADPNAVPAALPANLLTGYDAYSWNYNPSMIGVLPVSNPQSGIAYSFQLLDTELFDAATGPYSRGMAATSAGPGYAQLGSNNNGTSTTLTILSPRVASATVRVTAGNGCGTNGNTTSRDFYLLRPFHGSPLNRSATGGQAPAAYDEQPEQTASGAAARSYGTIPYLYPNPVSDRLLITPATPTTRYEYVVVLDAQGRTVQETRATEGVQELSLKKLAPGMYAVRLFDGKQFVTQRVVKE